MTKHINCNNYYMGTSTASSFYHVIEYKFNVKIWDIIFSTTVQSERLALNTKITSGRDEIKRGADIISFLY